MQPSTIVLDLDGVVWLAGHELPGASHAVALLRSAGHHVLFVTNNSSPTLAKMIERLGRVGIDANPSEVITASIAAASALTEGTRALVIGEAGVHEAVEQAGVEIVTSAPDAVVVGWERNFGFETISVAADAIRNGAAFIATNDDPTHPTPDGLLPGTGALVAAIATAAESSPLIAGKPGKPTVDLIVSRSREVRCVIGDRPSTDGALAQALGAPFGLVRSAATPRESQGPEVTGDSLLEVVTTLLDHP